MSWERDHVSTLIDLYREHECLYMVKSALYHNKSARQRALEQMASVISDVRPNTTVNDVKTKINSLRTQFNKECAKLRSKPSGCSGEVVTIKLWCFELLLFLQDQCTPRASTSNLSQAQDWNESIELIDEEEESVEAATPTTSSINVVAVQQQAKRRISECDGVPNILNKISGVLDNKADDEWLIFSKYVSNEIKNIKNIQLRTKCKRDIIKKIFSYQELDEEFNN